MSDTVLFPQEFSEGVLKPMLRPADYTLKMAVNALEAQLGTVEAYNRVAAAAMRLREQISSGKIKDAIPGAATPASA